MGRGDYCLMCIVDRASVGKMDRVLGVDTCTSTQRGFILRNYTLAMVRTLKIISYVLLQLKKLSKKTQYMVLLCKRCLMSHILVKIYSMFLRNTNPLIFKI